MATDIKEKPTLVLIGMEYRKGNEHVTNKSYSTGQMSLRKGLGKHAQELSTKQLYCKDRNRHVHRNGGGTETRQMRGISGRDAHRARNSDEQ